MQHIIEKKGIHQDGQILKKESSSSQNINNDLQRYLDMQVVNPDWQFAQKHGIASRPGAMKNGSFQKQKCICCLRHINKELIPLCANSKSLQFLGYGFPLYFIFLKYLMIIVLLLIVTYTSMGLNWAITQNGNFFYNNQPIYRQNKEIFCSSYMIFLSRIQEHVTQNQKMIRICSFVTLLLALLYMRDKIRKTNQYYDQRSTNYSDFSLLIQNLPSKKQIQEDDAIKGKTIGQIVKGFLEDDVIFVNRYEPIKIVFIGETERIQYYVEERKQTAILLAKIQKQLNQLQLQEIQLKLIKKQLLPSQKKRKSQLLHLRKQKNQQFQKNKKQLIEEKHKIEADLLDQNLDGDRIIVCFKEERERQYMENAFEHCDQQLLQTHFGSKFRQIKLSQAPQPHEINWQNFNLKGSVHIQRVIISWIIFVIILGALSASFYFLLKFKSHQIELQIQQSKTHPQQAAHLFAKAKTIVYISTIFIIIFNKFILAYFIHHLIQYERHITGQALQFALCLKYTIGLFFTTAIMTLLVEGATYKNVFQTDYGILQEETIMFYFSAFLVPAIWLINPWYILQWIKRQLYSGSKFLTQEQANKLMEDPQYLMGKRYGQLLQTVWFTFLYACVLPFGSILVFFGLGLYYWVDKYNLLRKSTVTEGLAVKLKLKALYLLDFILILKPAGELIFDNLIRHDWQIVSVVQLCLGFVYMCLPLNNILQFFHQQNFRGTSHNYYDLQKINILNYELYNPVTKEQQLKKHFDDIQICTNDEHPHSKPDKNIKKQSNKKIPIIRYKKKNHSHIFQYDHKFIRSHHQNIKKVQIFPSINHTQQNFNEAKVPITNFPDRD